LGNGEPCVSAICVKQCSGDGEQEQQDVRACERGGLKHVSSYATCDESWIYVFGGLFDGYVNVI